ncbi:hypothetical protein [Marinobacter changyiensis]|uniref:hypothetical protein n=1 Tax=Marinobacter changyiensis TaxID=2604091 RepID=UPI001264C6E5|nr:hypothetical protein [Marinobacter changyiensis]
MNHLARILTKAGLFALIISTSQSIAQVASFGGDETSQGAPGPIVIGNPEWSRLRGTPFPIENSMKLMCYGSCCLRDNFYKENGMMLLDRDQSRELKSLIEKNKETYTEILGMSDCQAELFVIVKYYDGLTIRQE